MEEGDNDDDEYDDKKIDEEDKMEEDYDIFISLSDKMEMDKNE